MNRRPLWFALVVWVFAVPMKSFAKSPYRYTLDPTKAEEVLASLAARPRLMEDQWTTIIGDKKAETYTVGKGDNLWRISKRLFKDPFLWRKLWEVNAFLTNPHELNSGDILKYYNDLGSRDIASERPVIRIPLIKLLPPGQGSVTDLDNDSIVNVDFKNRNLPVIFVMTDDDQVYGEIAGGYTERDTLTYHENIYINAEENAKFKPGQHYAVVHEERPYRDRTRPGNPVLGTLVRLVGEVALIEEGEDHWKAEVINISGQINRGDKLVALQKPLTWNLVVDPPDDLQTRIVMGEDPDLTLFVQGHLVILNKGSEDGMKTGYAFRVWREDDLRTFSAEDVEPESKGEVRVIQVGPNSSLGYIVSVLEPLVVGDTLIPRQAFSDPPPPPRKEVKSIEID